MLAWKGQTVIPGSRLPSTALTVECSSVRPPAWYLAREGRPNMKVNRRKRTDRETSLQRAAALSMVNCPMSACQPNMLALLNK